MFSDGGNGAAAGATAQATANTNEDATDTADAQQCSDLVHTESGKEPAIWQKRQLRQAIENWHESEARERELVARNRALEHALRQCSWRVCQDYPCGSLQLTFFSFGS